MKKESCQPRKTNTDLEKAINFLKVISEPNRLKILYLLQRKKICVCEIGECLNLPQNLVSHHLSVLRKEGIVSMKKSGLKVFYEVQEKVIKNKLKVLRKILLKKL
ncbi:winged helix-turn-helix transcriptional regulator [Candidatus Parcubacteria bacterium]|nr:winged helix-turn-helix transcriptional regulator [Candidatus Parcubacteria bacterium]